MKKLKEVKAPLLKRTRITYEIEHPNAATPKKEDIKKKVAEELNVKPELVSIRHIYSHFGSNKSKIIVHVYESEKDLKFLETPKGKKEKRVKKKKKKSAAKKKKEK